MFVLILVTVIVVALVFVAYSRRISWFDVVDWQAIEWEDYEDVEGWLTEEEVCNVIREWF